MVFFFKFKRHNSELNLYYIHVSKSRRCETVGEIWSKVNHDGMTEGRIDGTGNKTNALKLFSLVLNMDLKTYTKLSLLSIKVVQGVMCACADSEICRMPHVRTQLWSTEADPQNSDRNTLQDAVNIYSGMCNFIVFSVFDVKHSYYLSAYDIWQKRVNFQKCREI